MIRVERTTSDNEGFNLLVNCLDKDLLSRYEERQAVYDQYNIIENTLMYWLLTIELLLLAAGVLKNLMADP